MKNVVPFFLFSDRGKLEVSVEIFKDLRNPCNYRDAIDRPDPNGIQRVNDIQTCRTLSFKGIDVVLLQCFSCTLKALEDGRKKRAMQRYRNVVVVGERKYWYRWPVTKLGSQQRWR